MDKVNLDFNVYIPTETLFGAGELNNLHRYLKRDKKVLLVISNGNSVRTNGFLLRTEEQLHKAGVEVVLFDKVEPNPLKSNVMEGSRLAKENHCDMILALGGGSVIDASKAIALMATNEGDLWDYISCGTGKSKSVVNLPLPVVAIVTTAGTGSETNATCMITNDITLEKVGFKLPSLFPGLAIIDPELMISIPPSFTAFQGFDALFHSIEGYISNKANLMSDMYALTAIEQISHNLPAAVHNGDDLNARACIAFGSYLSGIVMCVGGLTSQHALENVVSGHHQNLPHGAGLLMICSAYFSCLIERHVCDDRFIRIAKAMGAPNAQMPSDFLKTLHDLMNACEVARIKMSDYGIRTEEFADFTYNAKETMPHLFKLDRIELNNDDCIKIYEKSFR